LSEKQTDSAKTKVFSKELMSYGSIAGSEKPISRVVLGSMALDAGRLPFSFSLLDNFVGSGGTCIDTAYVYGGGSCEKAVGAWFAERGNREQIYLVGKGACTTSCTPDLIARELSESLDRMQTGYVDLYFMHRDNLALPVSEFVECLNEHLRAGRMRAFGGSNWTPARLAEANAYAAERGLVGFAASSPNFSLALWNEPMWSDCMTAADLPTRRWYEESGMPLFAWSSQASGFFTGRFKAEDRATADPEVVRTWFNDDNFRRLDRAQELADKYGVTTTQIALAYVLFQPALNIYALIGPRTVDELHSSLEALRVRLSPAELSYLNLETDNLS
jgi:aryl-alcohol dehydrogenase-like predicted oxidoreductase